MEIVFHAHHADVTEPVRRRAEAAVLRAAKRIPRVVEVIVRFEQDGPTRRVTVSFRAPRKQVIQGRGEGRYFGPALTVAINKVLTQARREQVATKGPGARPHARARRS